MTIDDNIVKLVNVVAPVVLAALVYLTSRQAQKTARKAATATREVAQTLASADAQTTQKLDQIHVLVNARLTEALTKIDRLEARLYQATGEVPTGEPPRAPTGG